MTYDGPHPQAERLSWPLLTTYLHLGRHGRAEVLPDFSWEPDALAAYEARFAADGADGRLVAAFESAGDWPGWEAHPAGGELVLLVSGRADLVQWVDGAPRRIPLTALRYAVNAPNVWHTIDVHEPGTVLTITPGRGTRHHAREDGPPPG